MIKAFLKLDDDIRAFAQMTGSTNQLAELYEDANTVREVGSFFLYKNGVLTWREAEHGVIRSERYEHIDEDDLRDTLSFWRANLRRAKRYWAMDTEKLDKIQDGEIEDEED